MITKPLLVHYSRCPLQELILPGEILLWEGKPARLQYFLYWAKRTIIPLLVFSASWYWVATKQPAYPNTSIRVLFPLSLTGLGVVLIALLPLSSLFSHRLTYHITSERVAISCRFPKRVRYVLRKHVDSILVLRGRKSSGGHIILTAGYVDTPDTFAPMKFRLPGIPDIHTASAAIGRKLN